MSSGNQGTVKVVEVIGESDESWQDAAHQAVEDATETIEDVSGVDIVGHTAAVEDNEIVQYRATVHLSFPVER